MHICNDEKFSVIYMFFFFLFSLWFPFLFIWYIESWMSESPVCIIMAEKCCWFFFSLYMWTRSPERISFSNAIIFAFFRRRNNCCSFFRFLLRLCITAHSGRLHFAINHVPFTFLSKLIHIVITFSYSLRRNSNLWHID